MNSPGEKSTERLRALVAAVHDVEMTLADLTAGIDTPEDELSIVVALLDDGHRALGLLREAAPLVPEGELRRRIDGFLSGVDGESTPEPPSRRKAAKR